MLIISGYNVFPREIEEVLHLHTNVKEAAVIGKPDTYRGELAVAFVCLNKETTDAIDELRQYCREKMATHKIPQQFMILATMPKTVVGKIDKLRLHTILNEN